MERKEKEDAELMEKLFFVKDEEGKVVVVMD